MKKLLLIVAGVAVVAFLGLFFWARAALTGDAVRTALEEQLTRALGQPVTIARAGVSIFPRVTLDLADVAIGQPARVTVKTLHVGTDLRALISRRIEHGKVRLDGARVQLPLPQFAFMASSETTSSSSHAPVEIVSIDDVSFHDVEIVSGGRTLRGSVEVVPVGRGLDIRRVALEANDTALEITGRIDDLAGPTGELTATAEALDVPALLAFVNDFAAGSGLSTGGDAGSAGTRATAAAQARDTSPMNLVVALSADRAIVGTLALDAVKGRARLTPERLTVDPVEFRMFGGSLAGVVTSPLGAVPAFHANARVTGLDVDDIAAFAGSPGTITGRLTGTMDLGARGSTVDALLSSARGTATVAIGDGTVTGLGLVRSVVVATSMREGARSAAASTRESSSAPEPFSSLGATVAVAGGRATTDNLRFVSPDVELTGAGVIELSSLAVEVGGRVQLSEALSQQAGRDLVRYTQDQGRVTLPVRVSGTPGRFRVAVDMSEAARRAITNRASEELMKALGRIKKGGGGIF